MCDELRAIRIPLRLTYGLVPLLAGADKFVGLLADWPAYVGPMVEAVVPMSPQALMYVVGVVEIVVGVMVLTRWTALGAKLAMIWLTLIAVNLLSNGVLDVAVRDMAMAVGAYALAHLEELRETHESREMHESRERAGSRASSPA